MYPKSPGPARTAGYSAFWWRIHRYPPIDLPSLGEGASALRAAASRQVRGRYYLVIIALTVAFLSLSLYNLDYARTTFFDEPTYLQSGDALAHLRIPSPNYENPHPPLGKIILGVSIMLLGDNPIGWRFSEVIFGALMIPLLFIFSRKLFGNNLLAVFPATLLTFDFMHFVLARIALLETFFVFFTLLMQYCFYSYYQFAVKNSYAHSTKWMLLSSITFGLAVATKWPAVFSLIGFAIVFLYITVRRYQTTDPKNAVWTRIANKLTITPIIATALCLILSGFIYLATWISYFVGGWSLNLVLYWQQLMYDFHASMTNRFIYDSRWWSWPLMLTPIPLILDRSSTLIQEVLIIGNPAIWWATYPIVGLSIYRAFKKRDGKLVYLLVVFLSSWLPFAILSRFQIIYYYAVSVPLLILLITYWAQLASRTGVGKVLTSVYLAVLIILFIQFFPVISGQPIQSYETSYFRWLPSWGV